MDKIYSFLFNVATGNHVNYKSLNDNTTLHKEIVSNRIIDSFLKWDKSLIINGESWNDRKEKLEKQLHELKEILSMLKIRRIPFITLKGLAMLKYYPENVPRQSNDFDFLIKDIESFWDFHEILIKNGYKFVYFPMFTKVKNEIYGITKYYKEIDSKTKIFIEVNVGKFIISDVAWFGNDELWKTSQIYNYKGIDLNIPSDEMNIIILIIETSDRKEFFIRDLIDFFFIEQKGKIDWDYIKETLADTYLLQVLRKINLYKELIINNKLKSKKNNFRTVKREILHTLPIIAKGENTIQRTVYRYLKLFGEYFVYKGKFLSFLSNLDLIMPPKNKFYKGFVTHFIPINDKLKGKWTWYRFKKYDILVTPIGSFLSTNFAILEKEEEEEINIFLSDLERNIVKHERYIN